MLWHCRTSSYRIIEECIFPLSLQKIKQNPSSPSLGPPTLSQPLTPFPLHLPRRKPAHIRRTLRVPALGESLLSSEAEFGVFLLPFVGVFVASAVGFGAGRRVERGLGPRGFGFGVEGDIEEIFFVRGGGGGGFAFCGYVVNTSAFVCRWEKWEREVTYFA